MHIRYFNITDVTWSNIKASIFCNGRSAISNYDPSIDVMNVGGGIDVALVALMFEVVEGTVGGVRCREHHVPS